MENETKSLLMSLLEENTEDKYRLPSLAEVPWLIATHDNQKSNKLEKQTFRTNTNSCWKTIPELHRNIIVAAHQGWLILKDRKNYSIYSLWNPVTSQFLRLPELLFAPELEDDVVPSICLLTESLDLDNNLETCKLLLFFDEGLVFWCRPTMSHNYSWVKQRLELDDASKVEIETACVLEGVIYGYAACTWDNSYERKFVRIDFAWDSSNSITLNPDAEIKFQSHQHSIYMVESCGVLYYISVMSTSDDNMENMDIIKFLLWKLDLLQRKWIKVTSIRNRAFLLGCRCCTWCWAGARSSSGGFIEENCIYWLIEGSPKIYSYNLQDDSYAILLPHSTRLQNFYGPTWFMPENHKRLLPEGEGNQMISEETKQIQNLNQDFQAQVGDIQELSSGTLLSELPLDVLQSIGKCVKLFDYMNLRATCKSLHAGNPLEQWRANSPYPLFMVRTDNSGTHELFDPFENISRTILTFKKPPDIITAFEYCKDGWLLLRSDGFTLEYVNPFKRETGMYPPCDMGCATFGFSTYPTSPDCLIVGITGWEEVDISCFDAAIGEWEYFQMDFNSDTDIPFYPNHKTSPMYHKDAFYFLGADGCMGELEFLEEEISWHVYKFPFPNDGMKLNSSYLVELDGELVSVFIGEDGSWVKVFKFDTLDKCWMRLDTLGQHVLFVSPVSSFSIKSTKSVMNRIYLPLRKDNEIVFYSLDTGKYHTTSGGANSMDDFYGMKAQSSCCWI